MKKKILIVDDEVDLLSALGEYLSITNFEAICFSDPLLALEYYKTHDVDVVLSDYNMPQMNGINLFDKMSEAKPNIEVNFVVMSGHLGPAESKEFYERGVNELVSKPFEMGDIVTILNLLCDNLKTDLNAEKFFPILIADFLNTSANAFDIYLKVSNKYICLAQKGQSLTSNRIMQLQIKGVDYLYLKDEDYAKYLDMHFVLTSKEALSRVDLAKRQTLTVNLISLVSNSDVVNLIHSDILKKSLVAFEAYVTTIGRNTRYFELMDEMLKLNEKEFKKNTIMSIMASVIAQQWGWTHPKVQSKIIMASLMCDIGLREMPELKSKKRYEFSPKDIKDFETHPIKSEQILESIPGTPSEVLIVARQHHENGASSGYPYKVRKDRLHPYSRIVNALSDFLDSNIDFKNTDEVKNVLDGMFEKKFVYSEQVLKTMYMILGVEIPKPIANISLPSSTTFLT